MDSEILDIDTTTGTITIDVSDLTSMSYTLPTQAYSNYSIGIGTSTSNGTWSSNWTNATATITNSGLHVSTDAVIEGDLKVKGISIVDTLDAINKRLAILVPDPAKLEHFESLRKAYDHYKLLESLCDLPKKDNK